MRESKAWSCGWLFFMIFVLSWEWRLLYLEAKSDTRHAVGGPTGHLAGAGHLTIPGPYLAILTFSLRFITVFADNLRTVQDSLVFHPYDQRW